MANRKTRAQIEAETERHRFSSKLDAFTQISITAFHAIVVLGCAWFLYLIVASVAGTDTRVEIIVSAAVALGKKAWIQWAVTSVAALWAIGERFLRKRNVRRMGARNTALERRLDSRRSSSRLTRSGDTNPEDR